MYGGSTKKSKEAKFVIESDTQDQTYYVTVLGNYFQILKAKYKIKINKIQESFCYRKVN